MALSIKHDDADRLARALARETGETLTEAVITALRERLGRVRRPRRANRLRADIQALQKRVAKLRVLDARSADDILDYDEHGAPR
ncbi:MAG: type II toxin-antitoxin system VapB family antitoxin [Acidobacteria bacterium]|jgi:antitoxin VapB|nr:type II toxin-antitoxin system VapB family antitoxin [Acidobacteriota bacterium]